MFQCDAWRLVIAPSADVAVAGGLYWVQQVMADFRTMETVLTDRNGVHYQFKVLPYRTVENKIDGAVITIVDIAPDKPVKPNKPKKPA